MKNSAFTRQCIVCRQRKNKNDLIRFVKQNNIIVVDYLNNANGRGCYVCKSEECVEKLEQKNLLNRAFKTNISNENKQIIFKELKEFVGK